MEDNTKYRFSNKKNNRYVVFDGNGNILDAKGFGSLMWTSNPDIDKNLIGKHVDELAAMLEKSAVSYNTYLEFEAKVHLSLLKKMLEREKC